MIGRYALIAAMAVALVAMGWAMWLYSSRAEALATVARLDRSVQVLEVQREQVREAGRIAQEHRSRMASEAAQRDALIAQLLDGEGADAPVSDFLRRGAGRLFEAR